MRAAFAAWCAEVQDAALAFARWVDRQDQRLLRLLAGEERAREMLSTRAVDPGFYGPASRYEGAP